MADPIPDMDEFAQTRGADDLFDDEIIPVPAEELQQTQPEPEVPEETVTTATAVQTTAVENEAAIPPHTDTPPRSRGGERRGGRGRGRGRGGRGGAQNSGQRRSDSAPNNKPVVAASESDAQHGEEEVTDAPANVTEPPNKEEAATAAEAEAPRVPAVRGDRSATGGVKKPKLTEEELSRRIAAAKENAAKKAAAHARAEADQASFLEREKVAEKKRREERQNRRVMDSERERNRQRKLDALNGREWDAEKQEDQLSSRGGKGQLRRGMHGGVSGYTRRDLGDTEPNEELQNNPGQHNSSRGRGRGRGGRGRGNHRGPRDAAFGDKPSDGPPPLDTKGAAPAPVLNNEAEFPSLPGGEKKDADASDLDILKSKSLSPVSGATWAEQVESQRD